MANKIVAAQVSDTTGDASSNAAGSIKVVSIEILVYRRILIKVLSIVTCPLSISYH